LLARSIDNLGGSFGAEGRVDARGLIEGRIALGEHYTVEIAAVPQATRRLAETAALCVGAGDPVRRLIVRANELEEMADRLPVNDARASHLLVVADELRSIAIAFRPSHAVFDPEAQTRREAPAC